MPKSSNHLAIMRQWEMLKKLPSRPPGITAAELTVYLADQGYSVRKRTVERDLKDLEPLFGLACNDASRPYGWHWMQGKTCEFGSVEIADAVALSLAQDVLEKMLPAAMLDALQPKFEQARKKLDALEEHPYAQWPKKVRYVSAAFTTIPPYIGAKVMDTVFKALIEEQQIEIKYAPFRKKPSPYTLHPLGLVQKGGTAYLVATAYEYDDVRLYALHRMESARILGEKSRRPADYSLDEYIATGAMEFGSGEKLKLKAEVSEELGIYLSETPISEDQKIVYRKERWILTAEVQDTWQLHFWILSQGPAITILSPATLRSQIRNSLKTAVKGYD